MDMRMSLQGLPPGVQHTQEPDVRTEPFGVGCQFEQRGGTGFEQQGEQHSLVLPDDWNESVRHAENDVIVGNRQDLLLPRSKPLITCVGLTLRAMPVSTCNGELSITCLMGSLSLWGLTRRKGMFRRE